MQYGSNSAINAPLNRDRLPKYGLTIGNLNVRSLSASSDIVSDYVERHSIDIICFTETWLRRGEPDVPVGNLVVANRQDRRKKKAAV